MQMQIKVLHDLDRAQAVAALNRSGVHMVKATFAQLWEFSRSLLVKIVRV
jgi:hypothetical protein